jgi:selenocysteine lyase/cysteine desulfurase
MRAAPKNALSPSRSPSSTTTPHAGDAENSTIDKAFADFLKTYPAFAATQKLDALRESEYARLDKHHHIYLDYTGGGLYAESQLRDHIALLKENVFGNPHSLNPTSLAMTHLVEHAREYVLDFFNAPPKEYLVIFTANASAGLKLVGESYPFARGSHYLLTFDNHNSVNGIREFARAKGAETTYAPLMLPELRADEDQLMEHFELAKSGGHNLFAYPAQSNFSGIQHPLEWIEQAHAKGWDVLLDAAAFAPTNRLDLGRWHPDFVPLSFYKMFGYPTGVGCLLARREALAKLRRPWFAGGTITVASVQGDKYYYADGEAAFEDGTVNYLNLPAVEIGLKHLNAIGIEIIHERVKCLTGWLIDSLLALHHRNGSPLIKLYGAPNTEKRGGTVTMNFYDSAGKNIDHRIIEQAANKKNISLRTGCFCNPGGGEIALGITKPELDTCFHQPNKQRITIDDFRLCIDGKSTGAVRVSVGLVSNFADVYRFVEFARGFVDKNW